MKTNRFVVTAFFGMMMLAGGRAEPALAAGDIEARLDQEYQTLLAKDPDPETIRKAAQLFETTDRSAHWTNYLEALRMIRQHRSKAAIPLMMKYMIRLVDSAHSTGAFADGLIILTGEDIDLQDVYGRDRAAAMEASVGKLLDEWWMKKKDTITVDLNKMTDEQRRRIVGVLLKHTLDGRSHERAETAYHVDNALRGVTQSSSSSRDRPNFYRNDLCAAMTPLILERAGWVRTPKPDEVFTGPESFPYEVVPLLAQLRQDGQAALLSEVYTDTRQPSATRLASLLAIYAAGEKVPDDTFGSIAESEKRLEIRLLAIEAMQFGPAKGAQEKLLEFFKDPNSNIQAAAIYGLQGFPSVEIVPTLKRVIDEVQPRDAMYPALRMLGKINDPSAVDALGAFLGDAGKDRNKDRYISQALMALHDAADYPLPPGAIRDRQAQAAKAYEWWLARKGTPDK